MVVESSYTLVILGSLLLFSYLDFRFREIPSIFLTAMIFIVLLMFPNNLYFGVLALVLALAFQEIDYFRGMADLKVMLLIGLTINSLFLFSFFILFVSVFGAIWNSLMIFYYKEETRPFIPVFLITYICLIILKLYGLNFIHF